MDNTTPPPSPAQPNSTTPPPASPTPPPPPPTTPPAASTPPSVTPPPSKKGSKLPMILALLVVAIVAVAALLYYLMAASQTPEETGEDVINALPTSAVPTDVPTVAPDASDSAILATIQQAITDQSYETLTPLMSEMPLVFLYASECCGEITPDDATGQLAYLNDATAPWNWNQDDPEIAAIKEANPETFGLGTVGLSENDYVVSFIIENGQIVAIYLSASASLLETTPTL